MTKSKKVVKSCENCDYGSRLLKELHNPLVCVRCQKKSLEFWKQIKKDKPQTLKPEGIEVEIYRNYEGEIFFVIEKGKYNYIENNDIAKLIPKGQTAKFILTKKIEGGL